MDQQMFEPGIRCTCIQIDDEIQRLVIVTDPHGFLEPLEEVDRIVAGYGERVAIVAGGDYSAGGTGGVEVIEWVRDRAGELAVIGNHDRYRAEDIVGSHPPYTDGGCHQRMSEALVEYLQSMPDALAISWRGKLIHVMHGDTTRQAQSVSWQIKPAKVMELFGHSDVDLTVTGHTQYPFTEKVSELGIIGLRDWC